MAPHVLDSEAAHTTVTGTRLAAAVPGVLESASLDESTEAPAALAALALRHGLWATLVALCLALLVQWPRRGVVAGSRLFGCLTGPRLGECPGRQIRVQSA